MMKDKVKADCFYIFVNLNADKMSPPEFFICTAEEAKSKVKQYATRGIVDLTSLNSENSGIIGGGWKPQPPVVRPQRGYRGFEEIF
jgi:hypothetical protein